MDQDSLRLGLLAGRDRLLDCFGGEGGRFTVPMRTELQTEYGYGNCVEGNYL